MKSLRRSNRQRRTKRNADLIYWEECSMPLVGLPFPLTSAEKELLLVPLHSYETKECVCAGLGQGEMLQCVDCRSSFHLLCVKDPSYVRFRCRECKKKRFRPRKADVNILASALEHMQFSPVYALTETLSLDCFIKSLGKTDIIKEADLNTEDSSSSGSDEYSLKQKDTIVEV